jgi:hypothetical protein
MSIADPAIIRNRLEIQWRAEPSSLTDTTWQILGFGLYLTNGFVAFDDLAAAGQSRRFYRVIEKP